MKISKPWGVALGSLATVATTAGLTYGALALGATGGDRYQEEGTDATAVATPDSERTPWPTPAVARIEGILLTANRDQLAICVQAEGVSETMTDLARTNILATWPTIAANPLWEWAGVGNSAPLVELGCPAGPTYPDPGTGSSVFLAEKRVVPVPSQYKVFVFILPKTNLDLMLGPDASRVAAQEMFCEGHICEEVTTGLYLSDEDIGNSATLIDLIEDAIGLE